MRQTKLAIGTKVVIQTHVGLAPSLGTIVDGPMFISDDPFFRIEVEGHEVWHPAEHLGPYLRLIDD
ncbi:hypothetical protein PVT71_28870 (plasmid) [Salipiger sp. H15]|uniref:Uncharacterized protein n=1 Tax=Alloyangia sp. H15 TaxID=3029062 RepID=A0AAU8AUY4_9RHOB